jgi:hypothetical protein
MQEFTKEFTNYSKMSFICFSKHMQMLNCFYKHMQFFSLFFQLKRNSTTCTRQWEGVVFHHGTNNTMN